MHNKQVWGSDCSAGFQSLLFYTAMTWLPIPWLSTQALSSHEAGFADIYLLSDWHSFFPMTIPSLTTSLSTPEPSAHAHLFGLTSWCSRHFHALSQSVISFTGLPSISLIGTATSALPYLMVNFSLQDKRS